MKGCTHRGSLLYSFVFEFVCLPWSEVCKSDKPYIIITLLIIRYLYSYIRYDTSYIVNSMYNKRLICFPTPGRGLPYGSGLGLSRCLGPGECLHSFIHNKRLRALDHVTQMFLGESQASPFAHYRYKSNIGNNKINNDTVPLTSKSMLPTNEKHVHVLVQCYQVRGGRGREERGRVRGEG